MTKNSKTSKTTKGSNKTKENRFAKKEASQESGSSNPSTAIKPLMSTDETTTKPIQSLMSQPLK